MLFTAFYADEIVLYFNEISGIVIFICNGMGILSIDLNHISLDNTDYGEDHPDTSIYVRLLAQHIKFEKHKALKKVLNEELMPIARHPKNWWNFCISEDK